MAEQEDLHEKKTNSNFICGVVEGKKMLEIVRRHDCKAFSQQVSMADRGQRIREKIFSVN